VDTTCADKLITDAKYMSVTLTH